MDPDRHALSKLFPGVGATFAGMGPAAASHITAAMGITRSRTRLEGEDMGFRSKRQVERSASGLAHGDVALLRGEFEGATVFAIQGVQRAVLLRCGQL